jgi:hypothetical protein
MCYVPPAGFVPEGNGDELRFRGVCAGHLGRFCAFEISLGTLIRQVGPVMHEHSNRAPLLATR